MPFAVFRRHQRKLLAIFAILAMFGFVLADSLPRLLSGGYMGSSGDPVVVTLYGKSVHASDINAMAAERNRANRFLAELSAILYGAAGQMDSAFEQLDRALAVRDPSLVYLAVGPQWDSLRGDPRFDDRLKQMDLPRAG